MPNRILVIHEHPTVVDALTRAFDERGFSCDAFLTVDEALDYLCDGGQANVILYDGMRSGTTWLFGRAQEANPALLRIPLIALTPLNSDPPGSRRSPTDSAAPIDVSALLLIVSQLCRSGGSSTGQVASPRPLSREP